MTSFAFSRIIPGLMLVLIGAALADIRIAEAQPADSMEVIVVHIPRICNDTAQARLRLFGANILWGDYYDNQVGVRIATLQLDSLLTRPWVVSVHQMPVNEADNAQERTLIGVDAMQSVLAPGGGLDGAGVAIVMLDEGLPAIPNLGSRRIMLTPNEVVGVSDHATHVAGTLAGAGANSGPLNVERGLAPQATVYVSGFLPPCPVKMRDAANGVAAIVSQNSFSRGIGVAANTPWITFCDYFGSYDLTCLAIDKVVRQTGLSVVMSAGNWRNRPQAQIPCPHLQAGYGAVVPYGTAKNVITVGALDAQNNPAPFSPFGPTMGGRLKPDIVAYGVCVLSSVSDPADANSVLYTTKSGVSMAVPQVSGAAALVVERYRGHNANANPLPELVKAVLLNCADDIAPEGPDFRTGYGRLNVAEAVATVDRHDYLVGTVADGGVQQYPLYVNGSCRIAVMMAYSDANATTTDPTITTSASGNATLLDPPIVNDLDLELVAPDGGIVHPLTLDPDHPTLTAQPGVNRRDNVEQCVVKVPMSGQWILRVRGTHIPAESPQRFALVWRGADGGGSGLYMRDSDNPLDLGIEPNPNGDPLWASPDIWVRTVRDQHHQFEHQHQNPLHRTSGESLNYVYVQVRNRGCVPASGRLRVYAAKASTGLKWPDDWVHGDCCGRPCGAEIPSLPIMIQALPPGGTQTFEIPWVVPDPADGAVCGAEAAHYCLLARIETANTPPFGLAEGPDIHENVRNNSRIIWKNVTVMNETDTGGFGGTVLVRNPTVLPVTTSLMITSADSLDGTTAWRHGILTLELDGGLLNAWRNGGRLASGIDTGSFRVLHSGASIGGIHLGPREAHRIVVRYQPTVRPAPQERARFHVNLVQIDSAAGWPSARITGGERFEIVPDSTQYVPTAVVVRHVVGAGYQLTQGPAHVHATLGQPMIGIASTAGVGEAYQGFWYAPSGPPGITTSEERRPAASAAADVSTGLAAAPNPFGERARIGFVLERGCRVRLSVHDLMGRLLAVLADREFDAGDHSLELDGAHLEPGVYFLELVAAGRRRTLPVTHVR
ncbi:MAG: S8 family serine peptidase [Bacteroidetes bacterium]|nr:S8 family serine peptidase [Bacteroidota bacterium]